MRFTQSVLLSVVVCFIFVWPSTARAGDWNRETTAVFTRPVEIPGRVLPAGIYVFKLADICGNHNIVQIWNADQTVLLATVMGFPDSLREAPSQNIFRFEQRGPGEPVALLSWFYRGNSYGERFVYPKKREK